MSIKARPDRRERRGYSYKVRSSRLADFSRLCKISTEVYPRAALEPILLTTFACTREEVSRPLDPAWVTDIRDQCVRAKVPFFFKQWGGVIYACGNCLKRKNGDEHLKAGPGMKCQSARIWQGYKFKAVDR